MNYACLRHIYAWAQTGVQGKVVEKIMHLSMRMTKSLVAILLLTMGCSSLNSAIASLPSGCEYFDDPAATDIEPQLSDLLKAMPAGSAVRVCQSPQYIDEIVILGPIGHRDGVSYFISLFFQKQSANATTTELVEATTGAPYLEATFMAIDGGADINHVSEEFVVADFISTEIFKTLYTKWSSIIAAPKRRDHLIEFSSLDSESKAEYDAFIKSLRGNDRWKIYTLGFLAGYGLDFSPRFETIISGPTRAWTIEFDLVDGKTINLLRVSEIIE